MAGVSWNYRIIRKQQFVNLGKRRVNTKFYDVHEVYYDKKDRPKSWTENPIIGGFESLQDLRVSLSAMLYDSLRHEVLEISGGKKKRLVQRHK